MVDPAIKYQVPRLQRVRYNIGFHQVSYDGWLWCPLIGVDVSQGLGSLSPFIVIIWDEEMWGEVMPTVRRHHLLWGEVRWGEVRWSEMRWGEVRLCLQLRRHHLLWGDVRWGKVMPTLMKAPFIVRWGEVRWGEFRWGKVKLGEVRWG